MEQKHYLTKIVNFYNVYILDAWTGSSTNTFKFNNSLFGATNIAKKKGDKQKYVYSGCSWSFGKDTARNVVIFVVDNI